MSKHAEYLVQFAVVLGILLGILSIPYCATKKINENKQKCYDIGGKKTVNTERGTGVFCYTEDGRLIEVIR